MVLNYEVLSNLNRRPYCAHAAVLKASGALWGIEKLKVARSTIPPITHVANFAQINPMPREANPLFYDIQAFEDLTGCLVNFNTQFNIRDKSVNCTPWYAHRCFTNASLDELVFENYIVRMS